MVYSNEIDKLLNHELMQNKSVYDALLGNGAYDKDGLGEFIIHSDIHSKTSFNWLNYERMSCNGYAEELDLVAGKNYTVHIEKGNYVANNNIFDPRMGDLYFKKTNNYIIKNGDKVMFEIDLNKADINYVHNMTIMLDYVTQLVENGKLNEADKVKFLNFKKAIENNLQKLSQGNKIDNISLGNFNLQNHKLLDLNNVNKYIDMCKKSALKFNLIKNKLIDKEINSKMYREKYEAFVNNVTKYVNRKNIKKFKGLIKKAKKELKVKVLYYKEMLAQVKKNKENEKTPER